MTSNPSRSAKVHQSIGPNSPGHPQTVPTSTQDVTQALKKQPYPQKPHSRSSSGLPAAPESSHGAEYALSYGMRRMTMTTQPQNNQTTNVVLFGEPGVGKSAVVNLIARKNVVRVPSGVRGCTLQSTRYDIPIDNTNFCIFETVGLGEPEIRGDGYLVALEKAYEFVHKLGAAGGVHLLLFCIRATSLTATTQSNYRLFTEVAFQTRVPIALVVTGLEREVEMEDWWTKNKTLVERYGIKSDRHVCVAAVTDRTLHQDRNYSESQERIRELLKGFCFKTSAFLPGPNDWFVRLGNGMRQFVEKHRRPTRGDIVNMLAIRLKLDPKTLQGFVDVMDREDAEPGGSGGAGRLERGAEPLKSNTTKSRDLDTGKRSDEPPSKRGTGEVGMSQSQHLNAAGEEDTDGRRVDEVRNKAMAAGKGKAEPRKVNPLMETYVKSEAGVSIEDIRTTFPHDLTGYVTRSDKNPVASGSYGDIYRGRLRMKGKLEDVAIKVYRTYLQLRADENLPKRMEQFHREISVWVRLQHPNVLPLFGTIREASMHYGIPAMVCPWVENGALSGYLERNKGLTVTKRLTLVNDVAHGLQYLHSEHVVHGDLSGSNVLVRADGGAYIADFGLSRLLTAVVGPAFATSRQGKGTVRWVAPELVDPENPTTPTPQSDVYSFGSIMLQILTGNIPYHHLPRDEQVIVAIIRGMRPNRSDQRAVTDSRWKLIERCWSANGPRPSSDEIVGFTGRELRAVESMV